jgi:hypothetical protein
MEQGHYQERGPSLAPLHMSPCLGSALGLQAFTLNLQRKVLLTKGTMWFMT